MIMFIYIYKRLWLRNEIQELKSALRDLIGTLTSRGGKEIDIIMPGYTHLQVSQLHIKIYTLMISLLAVLV